LRLRWVESFVGDFVYVIWVEGGELFVEGSLFRDTENIVESKNLLLFCVGVFLLESFEFGGGRLPWWDTLLTLTASCKRFRVSDCTT
jgi:hypothetical protein